VAGCQQSWHNRYVSPTVLQSGPYRLFFFSSDRGEPVHVHVARDRRAAKFWLAPVRLEYNHGFTKVELAKVTVLVREHDVAIQRAWHEYFGGN
jgi:hypothetical protein